ncbi:uncharacterized protein TNCV_5123881 [Trichonephila clavipes]|nr:uncharacterized protein TNCV_5123881 [Trichonephila clavipes]
MDLRKWITNDVNLMEQWNKENFNVHPVHETVSLGANEQRSCLQYHWTDSKIVLFWIKGNKTRWKQFVANRVNEITSLTDPHSWYNCAGRGNILNSRPLTPLSSVADNFDVLTPGHFLIGRPITSISEPNLIDVNENRLSR